MAAAEDDRRQGVDDLWFYRHRDDDLAAGLERTARELEALRRRLELGSSDDLADLQAGLGQGWLPDKLALEQLKQEIYDQRQVVVDRLNGCSRLDGVLRRRWLDDLGRIDCFQPQAESQLERLQARVEDHRADLSYHSGSGSLSSAWILKSDLGLVAHELWQLARLCNSYQYQYGRGAG